MEAQNNKDGLIDLLALLLSMIVPLIALMMVNRGIEIKLMDNVYIVPYTDMFPEWSLFFYIGGMYAAIITTNWMILSHKKTIRNEKKPKEYKL